MAGMPAPHPDTDVLNAFAEQALPAAEREQILQHLAICEECRTVVVLALPPVEAVVAAVATEPASAAQSSMSRAGKQSWAGLLGWRNVSWAALAAGFIVAATLLMQQPEKQAHPVAQKQETGVSENAGAAQEPASQIPSSTGAVSNARKATATESELTKNTGTALDGGVSAVLSRGRKKDVLNGEAKARAAQNQGAASGAKPVPPAVPGEQGQAAQLVTQTASASGALPTDVANLPVMARNEMATPISRAKPPTAEEEGKSRAKSSPMLIAKAAAAPMAQGQMAPQWSISAGMLRRSSDGGATWQTALPDGRLLSYATHGSDVWTGGKAGLLFHSQDGGMTWTQVHPSAGDRSLSNDVTRLEMNSASEVMISTSNGETWSSPDNGKTWWSKQQ